MPTYTLSNGQTIEYKPNSGTKYLDAYNVEKQNIESTADAYRKRLADNLATDKSSVNTNYDNSAKQNYINYMQNMKRLPSQLSGLGVNGGASESALINLNSNYGSTYGANEASRNTALNSLQQNYDNDLATYNQEIDSTLQDKLSAALANQAQYDEDQAETELTRFANTVHRYTTWDGYTNWIKQLQASNDPLKNVKIAMVMQQRAIQFPDGNTSSSSSGGGYSGGGSGGGGSSSSSSSSSSLSSAASRLISGATGALGNPTGGGGSSLAGRAVQRIRNFQIPKYGR